MNKFYIFVGALLVVIIGGFLYLEIPYENNRTINENSIVSYYETYVDVNGEVVTTGAYGNSDVATLQESKFSELDPNAQKEVLGKKSGDKVTYVEDITDLATVDGNTAGHPYTYTITINKVKVDHSPEEPKEEETKDDKDSNKDKSADKSEDKDATK